MVYLDYSATTPVNDEVLKSYINVTKDFIGNVNSPHSLGIKSKELFEKATQQISEILNVKPNEIIYTSGASESNSYAIRGVAFKYVSRGKHIISSHLEHKSVLDTLEYLKKFGFEISYVKILENGQIDLEDLHNLIRKDTILITICAVNSECGYIEPIKTIRQIINKTNPKVIFHSDFTSALGKKKISLADVDLASFSGHKIYAPVGIGLLYKKTNISLDELILGFTSNTPFRGGTPPLALIVAFSKALRIVNDNLDNNIKKVTIFSKELLSFFAKYPVRINSYYATVPHIINISLMKVKGETFVHSLERYGIYVSTTSACSSNKPSELLYRIYKDEKIASSSIRISISHLTTIQEINKFIEIFDLCYRGSL